MSSLCCPSCRRTDDPDTCGGQEVFGANGKSQGVVLCPCHLKDPANSTEAKLKPRRSRAQSLPQPAEGESLLDIQMPFGKYTGQRIGDIPKSYCVWALGNLTIDGVLETALKERVK